MPRLKQSKPALLLGFVVVALHISAGATQFPISVWLQNPTNAAAYHAMGINTYVGLWQGPTDRQLGELHEAGMQIICRQNQIALQHPATTNIIAWMHDDEPDHSPSRGVRLGFGPIAPQVIEADYRKLRTRNPTRPIF